MTVTQESPTMPPPTVQVFGMWLGVLVTQMLRVAGDRGVWLRLSHHPRTSAELAAATGDDAPSLHRLLRALAGLGLLARQAGGLDAHAARGSRRRTSAVSRPGRTRPTTSSVARCRPERRR